MVIREHTVHVVSVHMMPMRHRLHPVQQWLGASQHAYCERIATYACVDTMCLDSQELYKAVPPAGMRFAPCGPLLGSLLALLQPLHHKSVDTQHMRDQLRCVYVRMCRSSTAQRAQGCTRVTACTLCTCTARSRAAAARGGRGRSAARSCTICRFVSGHPTISYVNLSRLLKRLKFALCTQDALDRFPHTIVELTGSNVTAATLDWAEGEGIDILVMGELAEAPAASTHVAR